MVKMTMNVLLSLIIQSKKTGRGIIGNGRLLVKLLQVMADNNGTERTHERNILAAFNDDPVKANSYHKIDKLIGRFIPQGKYYPYQKLSFSKFENSIGESAKYAEYLRKAEAVYGVILDENKIDSLVYTLLEIIRQDSNIKVILYGGNFFEKENLLGSYAHPKRICVEALLLGLLYHVHKNPDESQNTELLEVPDRRTFQAVHFSEYNSLNLELPINLTDNISENAQHQKSAELKYQLEFKYNDEVISELPENKNIFLYGTGGAGKTTVLLNQIMNENTVDFYFPLYRYKPEIRENLYIESCWILLHILLKYHYQYEYQTYETCSANEGEETILQQLTELEKLLKISPVSNPKYRLLLDGFNEIPTGFQRDFLFELEWICREWLNVRIIITGRTVPNFDLFNSFEKVEICGVTDSDLQSVLPDFSTILHDKNLVEILKLPIFLNMYTEINSDFKTTINNLRKNYRFDFLL